MKTAARALLTAAIAAMAAGAFSPPASAQTHPLNAREIRQRADEEARLQRQEAAARKKGNYNAAYWSSKERQATDYWNGKMNPNQHPAAQPAETALHRETRQRRDQEARLQRQEAAARKKGNYNAAYWSSKERQVADYWNKKGVH